MRKQSVQPANVSGLHYAQCWEDADILLEALNIQPGCTCLSIASAGDNTLAILSKDPRKVLAIDRNPAQIAALELRVAAFRELEHAELLALIGSVESHNRIDLYQRCRQHLSKDAREYWDHCPKLIEAGIGSAGKLERYLSLFRTRVLPLIHSRPAVEELFAKKPPSEQLRFYESQWNNFRWKLLFRAFFSRFVMGKLGRDRRLFRYVEGGVAEPLLRRMQHAMTELDPATNPYLHWIFKGQHTNNALPFALRPENFEAIRAHLDRLEWRCCSLEEFLEQSPIRFDAFNLSDIFEYLSVDSYEQLLRLLVRAANPNARLAYWNFLVQRSRPESFAPLIKPLKEPSDALSARDKAFMYRAFVVEEVVHTALRVPVTGRRDISAGSPVGEEFDLAR